MRSVRTLTASLEDYLETILVILLEQKTARVKDISRILSVREASVNKAISLLLEKGLVEHEKYGYIDLTKNGKRKAREILKKHYILKRFLVDVLGVDEKNASAEACKVEHNISRSTMRRIERFLKFIASCKNCPERRKWGF